MNNGITREDIEQCVLRGDQDKALTQRVKEAVATDRSVRDLFREVICEAFARMLGGEAGAAAAVDAAEPRPAAADLNWPEYTTLECDDPRAVASLLKGDCESATASICGALTPADSAPVRGTLTCVQAGEGKVAVRLRCGWQPEGRVLGAVLLARRDLLTAGLPEESREFSIPRIAKGLPFLVSTHPETRRAPPSISGERLMVTARFNPERKLVVLNLGLTVSDSRETDWICIEIRGANRDTEPPVRRMSVPLKRIVGKLSGRAELDVPNDALITVRYRDLQTLDRRGWERQLAHSDAIALSAQPTEGQTEGDWRFAVRPGSETDAANLIETTWVMQWDATRRHDDSTGTEHAAGGALPAAPDALA